MKIVSIVAAGDDAELADAHLAFHLNVGVDRVLAIDGGDPATSEVLASYERAGVLERTDGTKSEAALRTRLARSAVADHGADWVLSADPDEFWWPRGEGLKDVLAAIPQRYGVVQGLVRVFPPREGTGSFADRMTQRPVLLEQAPVREPVSSALRPVYRAVPDVVVDPADGTDGGRRVPLRAWYPIEVLRFPFRDPGQAERFCARETPPRSAVEAEALDAHREGRLRDWYAAQAGADGGLAEDVRLRDALRTLSETGSGPSAGRFTLPTADGEGLALRPPTIVDDAAYAGECAAVGEVDLVALDRHIRELEARIGQLEARFWPRVMRRLSRLTRR